MMEETRKKHASNFGIAALQLHLSEMEKSRFGFLCTRLACNKPQAVGHSRGNNTTSPVKNRNHKPRRAIPRSNYKRNTCNMKPKPCMQGCKRKNSPKTARKIRCQIVSENVAMSGAKRRCQKHRNFDGNPKFNLTSIFYTPPQQS